MATTTLHGEIVLVSGDLDNYSAIDVGQQLNSVTGEVTTLDLTGTSFISSAGLDPTFTYQRHEA